MSNGSSADLAKYAVVFNGKTPSKSEPARQRPDPVLKIDLMLMRWDRFQDKVFNEYVL